jgi:cobalamin biosynthesis protein CobD/CbiB
MKQKIKKFLSWGYFIIFILIFFWFGLIWFIPDTPLKVIIDAILIIPFVKSIRTIWRED